MGRRQHFVCHRRNGRHWALQIWANGQMALIGWVRDIIFSYCIFDFDPVGQSNFIQIFKWIGTLFHLSHLSPAFGHLHNSL
jgi:hypothetical protein